MTINFVIKFFVLFSLVFESCCIESPFTFGANFSSNLNRGLNAKAELRQFRRAAVTSDAPGCATIAKNMLQRGGAIGDATIAGLLCQGAVHPQSSGLGGGFIAVIYDAKTKKSTVLNAREKAPAAAHERMYENERSDASNKGGLAVAIPGEVRGYLELYKKYGGKVKWADLFQPTIELLESGIEVSEHLGNALSVSERYMSEDTQMREAFFNPQTDKVWQTGDTVRFPALARTMRQLAQSGGEQFYRGSIAQKLVQDLKSFNSIATQDDFTKYTAKWSPTITVPINGGLTMHTAPAPASGAVIAFVMRILSSFSSRLKPDDIDTHHIIVEAFKHAYGRKGKMGDPDDKSYTSTIKQHERNLANSAEYLKNVVKSINVQQTSSDLSIYKDDYNGYGNNGTAHFTIIDEIGNSITVTTTINTYFGARIRSKQTGIVYNDQMDDFNTKQRGIPNSVGSGKRPMSSACPIVFVDKAGKVKYSTGAAGGALIISAVSFVSMNYLWLGKSLADAIDLKRPHHTLDPNSIEVEKEFPYALIRGLQDKKHRLHWAWRKTVVTSVAKTDAGLFAVFDPRKPGSVDGY